MAQLVAHHTGSVGVRGSNPLSSTAKNPRPHGLGFFAGWGLGWLFDDSSTPLEPLFSLCGVSTPEFEGYGRDLSSLGMISIHARV